MQNGKHGADFKSSATFTESRERKTVLLLCLLASLHILFYSVAFPPSNNVDEYLHYDLVSRYARGDIPVSAGLVSEGTIDFVARYGSLEYCFAPEELPGKKYPPPFWSLPPDKAAMVVQANRQYCVRPNYEISQPPLYYVLAGFWWHAGHWLGLKGANPYYWLRLLDIFFIAALIILAYATASFVFPENIFLRLGVPALIAFVPQSEFYSIDNDVLSPSCFGLTFLFLLRWWQNPSAKTGAALGLAFAATYLAKITNLPLLAVVCAAITIKTAQCIRDGKWQDASPSLMAFTYCAIPPVAFWFVWCKIHFGDFFGGLNVLYYGWTIKPFAQWWHHPIFSPLGLWNYLSGQLGTFWQGEFWWHGQQRRLCLPGSDAIYTLLTLGLLATTASALLSRFRNISPTQRLAFQTGLACLLAGLGFYGLMSTVYDFHGSPNPSREHPYFQAGRMILGILIPFLLLFVYGFDHLLNRIGTKGKFVTLGLMIAAMLALEIVTDWPAFFSQYNWFHMPYSKLPPNAISFFS